MLTHVLGRVAIALATFTSLACSTSGVKAPLEPAPVKKKSLEQAIVTDPCVGFSRAGSVVDDSFEGFDANRDGLVDASEFECRMTGRFPAKFEFDNYWHLESDTNGDQKLSITEYLAAVTRKLSDADTQLDGKLSPGEWGQAMAVTTRPASRARAQAGNKDPSDSQSFNAYFSQHICVGNFSAHTLDWELIEGTNPLATPARTVRANPLTASNASTARSSAHRKSAYSCVVLKDPSRSYTLNIFEAATESQARNICAVSPVLADDWIEIDAQNRCIYHSDSGNFSQAIHSESADQVTHDLSLRLASSAPWRLPRYRKVEILVKGDEEFVAPLFFAPRPLSPQIQSGNERDLDLFMREFLQDLQGLISSQAGDKKRATEIPASAFYPVRDQVIKTLLNRLVSLLPPAKSENESTSLGSTEAAAEKNPEAFQFAHAEWTQLLNQDLGAVYSGQLISWPEQKEVVPSQLFQQTPDAPLILGAQAISQSRPNGQASWEQIELFEYRVDLARAVAPQDTLEVELLLPDSSSNPDGKPKSAQSAEPLHGLAKALSEWRTKKSTQPEMLLQLASQVAVELAKFDPLEKSLLASPTHSRLAVRINDYAADSSDSPSYELRVVPVSDSFSVTPSMDGYETVPGTKPYTYRFNNPEGDPLTWAQAQGKNKRTLSFRNIKISRLPRAVFRVRAHRNEVLMDGASTHSDFVFTGPWGESQTLVPRLEVSSPTHIKTLQGDLHTQDGLCTQLSMLLENLLAESASDQPGLSLKASFLLDALPGKVAVTEIPIYSHGYKKIRAARELSSQTCERTTQSTPSYVSQLSDRLGLWLDGPMRPRSFEHSKIKLDLSLFPSPAHTRVTPTIRLRQVQLDVASD